MAHLDDLIKTEDMRRTFIFAVAPGGRPQHVPFKVDGQFCREPIQAFHGQYLGRIPDKAGMAHATATSPVADLRMVSATSWSM